METIFDGVKGVYRVYNPDGSYNTYSPAQFKELGGVIEEVEEEEEADVVLEIKDEDVPEEEGDPSIPPSFNAPVDTVPTTGDAPVDTVPTTGDAPVDTVPTTGDAPVSDVPTTTSGVIGAVTGLFNKQDKD